MDDSPIDVFHSALYRLNLPDPREASCKYRVLVCSVRFPCNKESMTRSQTFTVGGIQLKLDFLKVNSDVKITVDHAPLSLFSCQLQFAAIKDKPCGSKVMHVFEHVIGGDSPLEFMCHGLLVDRWKWLLE